MTSCRKALGWLLPAIAGAGLVLATEKADRSQGMPLSALQGKGFRTCVDRHPNGEPKVVLTAGHLTSESGGKDAVDAADVRVELYGETGLLEGLLTTPSCRYERTNGVVKSSAEIVFQKGASSITGKGMEWNVTQQVVRVLQDVKIVIQGARPLAPASLLPSKKGKGNS